MIVRSQGSDLILITQPDHAALSRTLMESWRVPGLLDRASRPIVLSALEEHDIGWKETDAKPSIDARGRPHDFLNIPDQTKQAIWPRALERLAPERPRVAALIAQHALTVHRRHRNDPAWSCFFETIQRERDRLLAGCGVRTETERRDFEDDYAAVALGDLLSLTFCNGWTDTFEAEGYRIRLQDTVLLIAPDPYDRRSVSFSIRGKQIPNRPYRSKPELEETLNAAPVVTIAGTAQGVQER